MRLAAVYDRELPSTLFSIWPDALKHQPLEVLPAAFAKLERTFKPTAAAPFPAPAHLLEMLTDLRAAAAEDRAESAWQFLLQTLQKQFHPDLGWRGPQVHLRIAHACRAAGGIRRLWDCPTSELQWAKKGFVECYLRDEKLTENHALLPPVPEVSKLIESVAESKSLQSAKSVTSSIRDGERLPLGTCKLKKSAPMSDEQVEERTALLREQAEKLKTGRYTPR